MTFTDAPALPTTTTRPRPASSVLCGANDTPPERPPWAGMTFVATGRSGRDHAGHRPDPGRGTFLVGSIRLRSFVELHVETEVAIIGGAVIVGAAPGGSTTWCWTGSGWNCDETPTGRRDVICASGVTGDRLWGVAARIHVERPSGVMLRDCQVVFTGRSAATSAARWSWCTPPISASPRDSLRLAHDSLPPLLSRKDPCHPSAPPSPTSPVGPACPPAQCRTP